MQHYNEKIPSFVQRMDKDTFGTKENYNDSWEVAETEKVNMVYKRSRSQSREREHFSESVWDRTEVEGPPSAGISVSSLQIYLFHFFSDFTRRNLQEQCERQNATKRINTNAAGARKQFGLSTENR